MLLVSLHYERKKKSQVLQDGSQYSLHTRLTDRSKTISLSYSLPVPVSFT